MEREYKVNYNKVEELINQLNPNTVQCSVCESWKGKKECIDTPFNHIIYCEACWLTYILNWKNEKKSTNRRTN